MSDLFNDSAPSAASKAARDPHRVNCRGCYAVRLTLQQANDNDGYCTGCKPKERGE